MAAKPGQLASAKDNPVTVIIGPAVGSQPPFVRLASTVRSGKVQTLIQPGLTVPGTVLIGLPQSKATAATGNNAPPSSATLTTARRMVTRSIGKQQQEVSSKSHKRKLPKGSKRTAPKQEKGAKKGEVAPVVKLKKLTVSSSGTITLDSPKKRITPKKSGATNQVIPKATAGDGFKAFDIRVTHTPSESLTKCKAVYHEDHSYYVTKEIIDLKERVRKDENDIKRMKRNQKKLRMQVFRGNLKHRVLMKSLLLEQKLHKEAKQTLKAIKQGLQIEIVTVDPGA